LCCFIDTFTLFGGFWRLKRVRAEENMLTRFAGVAATIAVSVAVPAASLAAPTPFETAVTLDTPYVHYRLNEQGVATGSVADDRSPNNRDGVYQGSPGSTVGAGAGSDGALTFTGGAGDTGTYFTSNALRPFGTNLGNSSYEFVFRTNPGFVTSSIQSLFGVFNVGSTTGVNVDLNSGGNDALGAVANSTRLYVRGEDGDGVGVSFVNPALYDGGYHHLLFTFDASRLGEAAFAAYVDGAPQSLTLSQVNSGAADADGDPDNFAAFAFDPAFAARNVRGAPGTTAVGRLANVTLDETALYGSTLTPEQAAAHAAAIPEPASLGALGAAAAGLLLRRRRRG
jgi:hypothetical protein